MVEAAEQALAENLTERVVGEALLSSALQNDGLTMSGLIRSLRAHSSNALWTGVLLAVAGLVIMNLESVSFGHGHLVGGHSFHHHHPYFGAHEHPDHDHHDHKAPAPHGRHSPQRTATISVFPTLFQPVVVSVLAVPLAASRPIVSVLVLPLVMQPAAHTARPRAPPASVGAPKFREKGNLRCRP